MTVVGELTLWVGLFLAVWGAVASFAGGALRRAELVESGVRAAVAAAPMLALSCVGLWTALLRHDFSLEYVAAHTTMNTPTPYLVTAFWAGLPGAILWWAFALSVCAAIAVARRRHGDEERTALAGGVLATVLAFALAVVCVGANPFDRVEWVPAEGRGLSPALQHPLAAPHFIALYGAYAAAVVPLALAGASVRRPGHGHRAGTPRGWVLAAWCLLTVGVALRMRWTYAEPALGAAWSWEPAQSANMVLWLIGTAIVRSYFTRPSGAAAVGRGRAISMYVVYVGLTVLVVGLAARHYWTDEAIRLRPGQTATVTDPYRRPWRLVSQGASRDERMNYLSTGVAVEAWRGGESAGIISAERRQYLDSGQQPVSEPAVEPGIRSFVALDLYLLLGEMRGEMAELRVSFRPLVVCVWAGWIVIIAGAIAAAVQLTLERNARVELSTTRAV